MENFVQPGDSVELIAPTGGVVSGEPYQIGQLLVIAGVTAAQTLPFSGMVAGVFLVNKVSAQAWTAGALIYWDNSARLFTTVATAHVLAGVALLAAANPSATGTVRFNGSAGLNGA